MLRAVFKIAKGGVEGVDWGPSRLPEFGQRVSADTPERLVGPRIPPGLALSRVFGRRGRPYQ